LITAPPIHPNPVGRVHSNFIIKTLFCNQILPEKNAFFLYFGIPREAGSVNAIQQQF
jgi:hypothetical protein